MDKYWEKRFLKDKAAAVNASERYLIREQKKYFTAAEKEITEQTEKMYQSFADSEDITLAEAKRQIHQSDFSKVDFEKLTEYQIGRNRELQKKKDSLPGDVVAAIEKQHFQYESQLRALTRKGQLTHLNLLQANINKALIDLYDKSQISIYDLLEKEYETAYYRGIYNTQKAIGFGKDFAALNQRAVQRAVLNSYGKANYSKRLHVHCQNFSRDIKENLIIGLIRGESIDRMSTRIRKRIDVAASSARRLVRTETAYIYEQATAEAYQECGIEQYEFLATLDNRTSPICQELDGKVFNIKDAVPGKNYPPMHPNCRSTTVCHFDNDKVTWRIAKDKSGKYYEVPSDMTYREWEKVEAGLNKNADFVIKAYDGGQNITNERIAIYQAVAAVPEKVRKALDETKCIVGKYSNSMYDYDNDIMYIAKGAGRTDVLHEIGHLVDNKLVPEETVKELRKKMVQNVKAGQLRKEIYCDKAGNEIEITILKNEDLISEYQGRVYAESFESAFDDNGAFKDELLLEFVSEPFREYVENPEELLRKSLELYNMIKEAVT